MGYGFELRTESDNVLRISGDYFNLALANKIPLSSFTQQSTGVKNAWFSLINGLLFKYDLALPLSLGNPCVALTGNSSDVFLLGTIRNGGTLSILIYAPNVSALTGLNAYVFVSGLSSGKKYGRQVFNEQSGACVFDSNLKYMKMVAVGINAVNTGQTVTVPSNKTIATLSAQRDYSWQYRGDWIGPPTGGQFLQLWIERMSYFSRTNTTTFTNKLITNSRSQMSDDISEWEASSLRGEYVRQTTVATVLFLDVTNY
ncbi:MULTISPECIES: hypothetical protein [Acinetobacter]|nr:MULTISPECIES: hypothetical protein [Acinetobacter]ELW84537.1 hypothetical protein ACINWC743_A0830 [Acinetobacter sp. WC-743]MBJ8476113.1 hypothetical protein [Acinetobacter bereziniae]MDR6543782.1 hypothetical protein [Acinetobacter bereziniae]